MKTPKISLTDATKRLSEHQKEFLSLFSHNAFELELYKPYLIDKQEPHTRDEAYIIATGEATFELEGERMEVHTGDFLFVPAHASHRFVRFSDDFSTWVIFFTASSSRA